MKKPTKRRQRVAFVDIETSPNLAYVWGKWEQDVIRFKKEWIILSFSVKYLGEKKVHTYALPDFPLYKKDKESDRDIIKKLWEVFDDADIIVAHHGDRFDIPKSNARFIAHGLTPPSPYKSVDTKKIAKRYFKFDSNKLDDLGQYLGVGRKLETGGFSLWLACMNGDMKAWAKMKRYNGQDVILLEDIYRKFEPWHTSVNGNLLNETIDRCPRPSCGSKRLQRRGPGINGEGRYQRLMCQDCGGWCKGGRYETEKVLVKS